MNSTSGEARALKIITEHVASHPAKQYLLKNFHSDLTEVGNAALAIRDFDAAKHAYEDEHELNETIIAAEPNNPR